MHLTTVVRHLHKCLTTVVLFMSQSIAFISHICRMVQIAETITTVVRHSCECLPTVGASHDSRETFARVSYDVRASFIFSQLSLEMVLISYVTVYRICIAYLCRMVQIAETTLRCVCERLRRIGDGFATHAMTWRLFCDDFCRTKEVLNVIHFGEPFATSSRCMRGLNVIPCERLAMV